ncbi:tetratricopeptide repeat protein [Synoicihabitans lomoniglobus]|uniref:Tetratricopeptide repeat protein n=1 Tax=Synoicihabitans lomoniglobus TaxID=2909285 RepID=A0AAE9ZXT6_9BACT|nr:sel1 repeat family protein [Opitutaceae bacterium LMO-M01]WED64538.1 tetratricopeptide repeat protein [Opitutaceae bacterium LMO-M01]
MSIRHASMPIRAAALAAALALGVTAAHADDDVVQAAPVLVSTTAGGPQWETVKELIAFAEDGNPEAAFQYAQLLEEGSDDLAADPAKAIRLYEQSAAAGYGEALFRLGKINHDGLLGQRTNYVAALDYYQRAAALGVPEATYNVGAMHVSGRGTRRNYTEGLAWLMLAAEQGSDPGSVDQVKERLRKRPQMITAAENRLAGLKVELAAGPSDATDSTDSTSSLAPKPAAPAVLKIDAPKPTIPSNSVRPTLPSFAPAKPSIGVPSFSLPRPAPAPAPEPTDKSESDQRR